MISFGGFLRIGDEYRALPWSVLRYNENLDAYELDVADEQLRGAPTLATGWDTGTGTGGRSTAFTTTIAPHLTGKRVEIGTRMSGMAPGHSALVAAAILEADLVRSSAMPM